MTKILVDKMPVKAEECPFSAYYSKTCANQIIHVTQIIVTFFILV